MFNLLKIFRKQKKENMNLSNTKRANDIINKAQIEHPEFFRATYGNINPNIREGMRAYYELKGIESQEKNNRIINLLTIVTIILTTIIIFLSYLAYNLQRDTTALLEPNLEFSIAKNIFNSYDLIGFVNVGNHTYFSKRAFIEIYAINNGQRNSGAVYYTLFDENSSFRVFNQANPSINHLDSAPVDFYVEYQGCNDVYNEEELQKAVYGNCNYFNYKAGLMKWYLKVDCAQCHSIKRPQCFSFNICVLNSTVSEEWCRKQLEGNNAFNFADCPKSF